MKQTSVEFLHSEYKKIFGDTQVTFAQMLKITDALEQAKEIEKQQIIGAFYDGCFDTNSWRAEEYYNETFKNK
jgi:hypothetical protein